jgi:uncharacterized protein (TIGR03086 family)
MARLSRALDQSGALIARVAPVGDAADPVPCRDVRVLVNHVMQDVRRFTTMVSGAPWEPPDTDVIADDGVGGGLACGERAAAGALLAAWQREGALDGMVKLPFGEVPTTWSVNQPLADLAVHGWDIARATGQATDLDPELGQAALEWARENLRSQLRGAEGSGRAFGPEVPVPESAPLYDRLAAFFGRDPR